MQTTYDLLVKTSRTFALAIPLLPEPTRHTVCLAYLLFRIADTLEDAAEWSRDERLQALEQLGELFVSFDMERARHTSRAWLARGPTRDHACLELLTAMPDVLAVVDRLGESGGRSIVLKHAYRTARGMHATLVGTDEASRVRIATSEELRAYCYAVAGIVGELLTELFVHDAPPLRHVAHTLAEHAVAFGEGLQLVNILKDEAQDALDGRVYLPPGVPRADLIALARSDIARARLYIEALKGGNAPPGFVAFTTLPADLAEATLILLERDGPGAKVPRSEVLAMFTRAQHSAVSREDATHSAMAQSGK